MQNNIIYKTIITFFFLILTSAAFSQSTQIIHGDTIYYDAISYYLIDGDTAMLDPGHVTIEFNTNVSEQQQTTIESAYSLTKRHTNYMGRVIYKTHPGSNYLTLLSTLPNEASVDSLYYEFIFERNIVADTSTYGGPGENLDPPDDPWYEEEIYNDMFVTQDYAWTETTGNPDIIIAVMDNAIDWTLPDLGIGNDTYQNVAVNENDPWSDPNDPTSGDGIDNDNNGFTDDYKGWDLYDEDNNILPPNPVTNPDDKIPTALATMTFGKINNDYGVAGIAGGWEVNGCKLLACKIGEGNTFTTANAAIGIDYAIQQGAKIINLPWFCDYMGQALTDAIVNGYENYNVSFFAMSGIKPDPVNYPAKHPYVNCVAGTVEVEQGIEHFIMSSVGAEVDFAAPCNAFGLHPFGTGVMQLYGTFTSTSLAAGVAGLLLSVNPCLKNYEITDILQNTAQKVGDDPYDENGHNIYLGYGLIHAYDAIIMAMDDEYYGLPEQTITNQETWTADKRFSGDIIIEDGGVLTLSNNTIEMKPGHKILVEVGGRLIINGATITGFCDDMWDGIVVQGNPNIAQLPYTNQGSVYIYNEATIENALCGLQVYDDNGNPGSMANGGGHIIASDAEFLNNKISISFGTYAMSNFSSFTECLFKCTDDYVGDDHQDYFVKFYEIEGVDIINCEFKNSGYDEICRGVYSYNSAFTIDGECTSMGQECLQWDPTLFTNLEYAVYATGVGTTRSFSVKHSTFTNNFRGIYASGINFVKAWSNTFNISNSSYNGMTRHGFYLNNCTGYHIEDNSFNGTGTGQPVSVGLYISNSGPWANWVYRNNFDNLYCGSVANGRNRAATGEGLCYKCNNFSNNDIDISVPRIAIPDGPNEYGIAYSQGYASGTDTTAAGNTFSSNSRYDFYNGLAYLVYTHHEEFPTTVEIIPDPRTVATIGLIQDDDSNYEGLGVCNPWFGGEGTTVEELRSGISVSDAAIAQTKIQMATTIDGGNTSELNNEVQYSFPPDATEVHQELLDKSPYLSDTVMQTAIAKEEVLPNAMIRDVLVANPQSAKSAELMEKLDERITPMPEPLLAEIYEGLYTTGALDGLRLQLANQKQTRGADWMKLYELYLTQGESDSIAALLATENTLAGTYIKVQAEIFGNNYTNALSILNQLPNQYQLSANQLSNLNHYIEVVEILADLDNAGKTPGQLDGEDIDALLLIAENEETSSGVLALNLLTAAGEINYYEPILLPDPFKSEKVLPDRPRETNVGVDSQLKLFPNPAGTYFIIEYNLDELFSDAVLKVNDISGRERKSVGISKCYNQMVINTATLEAGIYYVVLEANGKKLLTKKLTISK